MFTSNKPLPQIQKDLRAFTFVCQHTSVTTGSSPLDVGDLTRCRTPRMLAAVTQTAQCLLVTGDIITRIAVNVRRVTVIGIFVIILVAYPHGVVQLLQSVQLLSAFVKLFRFRVKLSISGYSITCLLIQRRDVCAKVRIRLRFACVHSHTPETSMLSTENALVVVVVVIVVVAGVVIVVVHGRPLVLV